MINLAKASAIAEAFFMSIPEPHIKTVMTDTASNVRYIVWAYRKLSRVEMVQSAHAYRSTVNKLPKNATVVIKTILGIAPGL